MKPTLKSWFWPLAVFIFVLVVWHTATVAFKIPGYIFPQPLQVWKAVAERPDNLLSAFKITALEAAGGFLASIVVGVVIALFFAQSPLIRRCLYPYTILLQTVPIVAIAPLILMWFGSGLKSVMLVAFIICLFPIIANTTQGLVSVDPNLLNLFKMSNANRWQVLMKLRLPHAVPSLFVGLRISAGISVIGAITGELFASSNAVGQGGLGYSIIYANSQLQTDYLFGLVIACAALGFSFFFTIVLLEWWFLHHWHESAIKSDA